MFLRYISGCQSHSVENVCYSWGYACLAAILFSIRGSLCKGNCTLAQFIWWPIKNICCRSNAVVIWGSEESISEDMSSITKLNDQFNFYFRRRGEISMHLRVRAVTELNRKVFGRVIVFLLCLFNIFRKSTDKTFLVSLWISVKIFNYL